MKAQGRPAVVAHAVDGEVSCTVTDDFVATVEIQRAAVQGGAIGGGLGLACAADFRVASRASSFTANFARLGFHHGFTTDWIGAPTAELLAHAPGLRWLQSPTISLEALEFPELNASSVVVTNMRNVYNDHIANHVIALILAHCRQLTRFGGSSNAANGSRVTSTTGPLTQRS